MVSVTSLISSPEGFRLSEPPVEELCGPEIFPLTPLQSITFAERHLEFRLGYLAVAKDLGMYRKTNSNMWT